MEYFISCLNWVSLLVQCFIQLVFVCRLTGKRQRAWYFAAFILPICILQAVALRIAWPDLLSIALGVLILYAVSRWVLKNGSSAAWLAAILDFYIQQLSFGLLNSVELIFFPRLLGRPLLYLLVLATVAAFAVCAACYLAVLKLLSLKENRQEGEQTPYIALLLFPSLFCFLAELYILDTAYTNVVVMPVPLEAGKHLALLLVQALGLAALFCTLYAYRKICRGFQAQAELQSLTQAAQAQKVYIAEARQRYEQTQAFRHDIKNHLSILGGLLRRGDLVTARQYLQKLDAASAALSFPYQTGNSLLDILLAEKLGLAGAAGIAAKVELIWPQPCAVDDFDLCVIFANALDNAVSACRELTGDKSIRISGEKQGDFYLLCFENTCSEQPLPPEGVGLANIRAAAAKYQGAVQIEKQGRLFSLSVLLNIAG